MPEIPVSREMIGKKLDKDIFSPFGGLLYQKGHLLREKDLEFLLAFKIQTISVEEESKESKGKHGTKKESSSPSPKGEQESSFIKDFRHAAKEMEKIFIRLMAGGSLSVAEIRQWLKPLVEKTEGSTGWLYSFQENSPMNYQAYHAVGTALLSVGIARSAKIPKNEWMQIGLAGLLSDLGKVKIPSSILQKKGPLTKEEWEEVRRHPIYGFELLKNVKGITEGVILSSLQHHERLDGSGYPLNLTREKIHPYAKIVAIADVIHAASSNKPYRTAFSPFQVMEQMRVEMTNQFDTGYLHTLIQSLLQLPLGTPVLLSDGRVGKILYFMPTSPLRPILDVDGDSVSLMDRKELHLEKILIEYQ
ncbi:MAG: HD-GYP domain-containing protein [Thermicanus sp.]|nr:HD-GYP domain-containing protein [Thermicanus sp.]